MARPRIKVKEHEEDTESGYVRCFYKDDEATQDFVYYHAGKPRARGRNILWAKLKGGRR